MDNIRTKVLSLVNFFCRNYIRYSPVSIGKVWLWEHIVEPYFWGQRQVRATSRDGFLMELKLPDIVQNYLYYFGIWEPNLSNYFRQNLKPGDIVIDCGANVGYYSLLAAKIVTSSGKVHAIEASPKIVDMLTTNVKLNNFGDIIEIHHKAVSDKKGQIEIFNAQSTGNLGATTTWSNKAERQHYASEGLVSAAPLGEIISDENLLAARIIKIDVEGAEVDVIRGITSKLAEFSDQTDFIIEFTNDAVEEAGETVASMIDLFAQAGFEAYYLANNYSPLPYLKQNPPIAPVLYNKVQNHDMDIVFSKRILH